MAPSEIDFYKVLGLQRYATEDDIKKAWRKAAKDTHPDKNPDDPNAKQKFQELQQAYDTLKDHLERSKYDEDNPYHGRSDGGQGKAKSATAKRYTGSAASTAGWPPSGGGPPFTSGFSYQSSRYAHKPPAYGDDRYYASSQKTRSGFDYTTGGFRGSPRPAEYEDEYYDYDNRYDRRETAYARTHGRSTPTGSRSNRPKSTPGMQTNNNTETPASGESVPDFDLNAYIRERRAKEAAMEERARREKEEEERRREAEIKKAERAAKRAEQAAREAEKARYEEHKRQYEAKKAEEEMRRAEAEARRVREEDKSRHSWAESTRNPSARDSYTSAEQSDSVPFSFNYSEDDISRMVEEQIAQQHRKQRSGSSASASKRHNSKKSSPTKPKERKHADPDPYHSSNERQFYWKSGNDQSNMHRAFPHMASFEHIRYAENSRQQEEVKGEKQEAEKRRSSRDHLRKSDEYLKAQSTKSQLGVDADQAPRPKSQPVHINGNGNKKETFSTPPTSPKSKKGNTSHGKSEENKRPEVISDFKFDIPRTFGIDPNDPDSFTDPHASERSSPFSKNPDFSFHGECPSPFKFIDPETPQGQNDPPSFTAQRPQSQPVHPTQPAPPPPPANSKSKKSLLESLATTFMFGQATQGPSKKKSAPNFKTQKSKSNERSGSFNKDYSYAQPSVETDNESDTGENGKSDDDKEGTGASKFGTNGIDFIFMGKNPDTGIPTSAAQKPPLPNRTTPVNGSQTFSQLKPDGLDSTSKMAVPPSSRSPADVGLGLDELELPLPLKSASSTPIPSLRGKLPKHVTANIKDLWEPQTPAEEEFNLPLRPKIPLLPTEVSLTAWNGFFAQVEPYLKRWNDYEQKVHEIRGQLIGKSPEASVNLEEAMLEYIKRVKERDMRLEEAYVQARGKHVKILEEWMNYRRTIYNMKKN